MGARLILLVICEELDEIQMWIPPPPPPQKKKGPVIRNFDVLRDVCMNKLLNKQSICGWFKTSWRDCDVNVIGKRVLILSITECDPFISLPYLTPTTED